MPIAVRHRKCIVLRPAPPFRLDLTVWALRRSPANRIDDWDGKTYRRVLAAGDRPVEATVVQTGPSDHPEIQVRLEERAIGAKREEEIIDTLGSMLGCDVDLTEFYRLASAYEPLDLLVRRFAGLKPPRLPTLFETLINGIACQQLSLNVCILLLNRLCASYGLSAGGGNAFPRPADLVDLDPEALKGLGFSRRKAEYILSLAESFSTGGGGMASLAGMDDQSAMATLLAVKGIGPWTAEYVMLRGLGRLNVIPADDLGIQNKLKEWLGLDERPASDSVRRLFPMIGPYRGLIYFFLLVDHLNREGRIDSGPELRKNA